jgi:hypothetical protein
MVGRERPEGTEAVRVQTKRAETSAKKQASCQAGEADARGPRKTAARSRLTTSLAGAYKPRAEATIGASRVATLWSFRHDAQTETQRADAKRRRPVADVAVAIAWR